MSEPIAFDPTTMAAEEFRAEPSLSTIKTVPDLVKGYVNAQKLIGAKRIALPGEKAGEGEWNEFYNAIGRPETFDKYEVPDIKLEDGLEIDKVKQEAVLKHFHKLGMTKSQARGALEYYLNSMNEGVRGTRTASETAATSAQATLKAEWGDKYQVNVDTANAVIKKFGDEKLLTYLQGSGMGNNVDLIRLLSKVGQGLLDDTSRGGGGGDLPLNDRTRASQEIDRLKIDPEFQAALGQANHVGHRAAVDRWLNLHSVVNPGKSE